MYYFYIFWSIISTVLNEIFEVLGAWSVWLIWLRCRWKNYLPGYGRNSNMQQLLFRHLQVTTFAAITFSWQKITSDDFAPPFADVNGNTKLLLNQTHSLNFLLPYTLLTSLAKRRKSSNPGKEFLSARIDDPFRII